MKNEIPIVYVVDDDSSVLKSLERLLRAAGYEVKTFPSAIEFLDYQHPDTASCLILDVMMPELDGLELQKRLTDREITFPVVFISGHGTIPMSVHAMKAGAVDSLQKPLLERELIEIVSGAIIKDRQARQKQRQLKKLRERLKTLTPREYEVFGLVVTGMMNKQIAFHLGTAEKTIKVHRARVMGKLGAESLADLVRFAERLGIRSQKLNPSYWTKVSYPSLIDAYKIGLQVLVSSCPSFCSRRLFLLKRLRCDKSSRDLPDKGESPVTEKDMIVIVVDDDASVRRAMKRLLMSNGYQVITFESGEDLLLVGLPFDKVCLLLDIRLSGISGLDLYAGLASSGLKCPVIFMTAHDDPKWPEKAENARAVAFLRKPFGEQSLLGALALAHS